MIEKRQCTVCGTSLSPADAQPLCPACIFRRLASTGSTIYPSKVGPAPAVQATLEALQVSDSSSGDEHDTDFYSEYELLGEIGRGGMGVIYKAHQPELNRIVALKVIHAAGLAGDAARKRFQSEIKIAGRLSHPNIVPVFDVGVMDGCPCFSMEYFPGGSLAHRLGQPGSNLPEAVKTLLKVARAVYFAHQHGVLHRDLKPGNILLDADGEPHVADFGLAKELDSSGDLTRSGAVLGSPNYMSPEQATGKAGSLSVATDVYSLGAILYEMLTGRPPFLAATPLETMRLVVEQEAPRPSSTTGRVDRDLETICLKCLEKDPARRYATAVELAEDLERWLRREPIQARAVSNSERVRKWIQRHPALATVSALLLVVLLAGFAAVTWQWRTAEDARQREMVERRRAEVALAHSAIALAESALREGNGPAVQAALATVPKGFRDGTWSYLLGESDTSRPLPPIGIERLAEFAANPARASVFAAADRAGKIVLFNVRDGSRLIEFTPGFETNSSNAMLCLAFSRTGDRLAIGRSGPGGIVVHDTRDGGRLLEWAAPPSSRLEFSPDGTRLLQTGVIRRQLILWDAVLGTQIWMRRGEFHSACFLDGGSSLANFCWGDGLRLITAEEGVPGRMFPGNYLDVFAGQPGGALLVAGNILGFVRGFDVADGRQRFEFQPHESAVYSIAFLPGSDRFLTAATLPDGRQALQCWDAASGRHCQTFNGGGGDIRALALHPLSGELIVAGREIRVWEAASLAPVRTIRGHNAHPSAVFWGAEDQIFAPYPNGASSAHLQSLSGELSTKIWSPPDGDYGQPSVSADGRRVAIGRYNSAAPITVVERDGQKVKQVASLSPGRVMAHLRISPNGDRVAVVQSDFTGLGIVDVATGKPAVTLETPDMKRFSDVAWLEGGKLLVGLVTTHAPRNTPGSTEQIVLWETATGRLVRSVTNASLTRVACAAPDGRRFVEAGADRNVRLRDGTTLEMLREFRVHNAPITALAWHPSRSILATASADLVIRLWNLDDGNRLEELRGPLSPPNVLSFSPGGTRLATASRDGAARIWEPRSLAPVSPQK